MLVLFELGTCTEQGKCRKMRTNNLPARERRMNKSERSANRRNDDGPMGALLPMRSRALGVAVPAPATSGKCLSSCSMALADWSGDVVWNKSRTATGGVDGTGRRCRPFGRTRSPSTKEDPAAPNALLPLAPIALSPRLDKYPSVPGASRGNGRICELLTSPIVIRTALLESTH